MTEYTREELEKYARRVLRDIRKEHRLHKCTLPVKAAGWSVRLPGRGDGSAAPCLSVKYYLGEPDGGAPWYWNVAI